ncbi:WD40 repeat domain 95 [Physocladia obscura]|uniref:WD40 repeat domain 95 n=1 Tax=Physocladia obscura TaxID=109957 RepID=A0AAD5XJI2_9FUNG|nr:WD40 repeat domain 95 [Physocladia obscura]
MASFKGHGAPVVDLMVNEEHGQLISLSVDDTIKVWDIRKQTCLQTICDRASPESSINKIFFCETDPALYALAKNITKYKMKGNEDAINRAVVSLQQKTENDFVVVAAEQEEKKSARKKINSCNSPLKAAIYNPVFKQIITAGDDGTINVWDAGSGQHIFKFSETHGKNELTAVAFDIAYRKLITGARDGTIYIWNFHNGQKLKELIKNNSCEVTQITQIEMNATRYIIIVGWDKRISIYIDEIGNIEDKQHPYSIYPKGKPWHNDDIMCVTFTQPNILVTGSFDGTVVLSNMQSGHMLRKLKCPEEYPPVVGKGKSVEQIVFLTERKGNNQCADLITACGDGIIRWWRTCESELMWEMNGVQDRAGEGIYAMRTDDTNTILITGDTLGYIVIYNIKDCCIDGRENISVPTVLSEFRAHLRCIVSLELMESHILTASTDGTSRMFTNDGLYIGTLGQELAWDINESAVPPIPPDIAVSTDQEESLGTKKFRRASFRVMENLRSGRIGDVANSSASGKNRAINEMRLTTDNEIMSASNKRTNSVNSSADVRIKSSFSELPPLHPNSGSMSSVLRNSSNDFNPSSSKRLQTPDLLQTNYKTWYGQSSYAQGYLDRERIKGKTARNERAATTKTTAFSLPDGKVSNVYHKLRPSELTDFSETLRLPVISALMSKPKLDKTGVPVIPPIMIISGNNERQGVAEMKRGTSGPQLTFQRQITARRGSIFDFQTNANSRRSNKSSRRLNTPAIREIIDSDAENKKQAVQDYIFG